MPYFQFSLKFKTDETPVIATCKASHEWKARHYLQDAYKGEARVTFLREVRNVSPDDDIIEI